MSKMELLFIGIMWVVFILFLLIIPTLVYCLIGHHRERRTLAVRISLAVLGAEILAAVCLCMKPPIISLKGQALDTESEKVIRYVSDGRYNDVLPVFPTAVIVIENEDGFLRWQTYYGFWGRTEHIYSDTYEMTEPLWRN